MSSERTYRIHSDVMRVSGTMPVGGRSFTMREFLIGAAGLLTTLWLISKLPSSELFSLIGVACLIPVVVASCLIWYRMPDGRNPEQHLVDRINYFYFTQHLVGNLTTEDAELETDHKTIDLRTEQFVVVNQIQSETKLEIPVKDIDLPVRLAIPERGARIKVDNYQREVSFDSYSGELRVLDTSQVPNTQSTLVGHKTTASIGRLMMVIEHDPASQKINITFRKPAEVT